MSQATGPSTPDSLGLSTEELRIVAIMLDENVEFRERLRMAARLYVTLKNERDTQRARAHNCEAKRVEDRRVRQALEDIIESHEKEANQEKGRRFGRALKNFGSGLAVGAGLVTGYTLYRHHNTR